MDTPFPQSPPPVAPLWLLALFAFSGTLALHMFVPTLTMAGLTLYTLAGFGTVLTSLSHQGAGVLIAARLFQALGGGCATTSFYAFIASTPFIFVHQLNRPEHEVGLYLTTLASGMWLGNALSIRLLGRVPLIRMATGGNLISLGYSGLILLLALTGYASVLLVLTLMFLFTVGTGFCSPAVMILAINVNPAVAGSASGLYGRSQMTIGALCSALAGLGRSPLLTTALLLACVFSQGVFYMARHAPLDEQLVE